MFQRFNTGRVPAFLSVSKDLLPPLLERGDFFDTATFLRR